MTKTKNIHSFFLTRVIAFIIIFLLIIACQSHKNRHSKTPIVYIPIKEGLFRDSLENIYFEVTDITDYTNPIKGYIHTVWSENFGVDGTKEMKDIIDTSSFHFIGFGHFKDKNNIYFFFPMSDGGSMSIIDNADLSTFQSIPDSQYGMDETSVFYRGTKIKNADRASFEPVYLIDDGRRIGWHARDKHNYYSGNDIMSDEEIIKFGETQKEILKINEHLQK